MKPRILLLVIFLVALVLRFFHLGVNPPSLTWDEVAWGYNAYSIGIDGKDEFGRFLPHDYLESFGDFKPPVYAYLTVLPVKIFGLNEFAVRFPSALFGSLTVLLTYFLTKKIFRSNKETKISSEAVALCASLFLAIAPWHINLSRAGFEANVSSFFIVSATLFFVIAFQEKKKYLIISAIFFVLSLYTFNTARVFVPLFVLFLAAGSRKWLLENKKTVILSALTGLILLLPTLTFLFSPQASLRFKEVNIFSDISIIYRTNQQISRDNNAVWSKIIHNRRITYGVEFLKHYLDNLNPSFLFIKGDGNPKFSTQDVGQMYMWDIPFFIIGIFLLFRFRQGAWWIIPGWILLGLIPAGTARETPHALRIETVIPMFQILTAYGFVYIFQGISNGRSRFMRRAISTVVFGLLFLNVAYYLHGYYTHYPYQYSGEWQYGYKDSIQYVMSIEKKYENIYVTSALGRPYAYYLFYTKTDPDFFRKTAIIKRDVFGFVNVQGFGKYHFMPSFESVKNKDSALFIDTPEKVPSRATKLKEFKLLNGNTALVGYTL